MRLAPAFLIVAVAAFPLAAFAQPARPIPYPVIPPDYFVNAIESGTRTDTGEPGTSYWRNEASYELEATLRPSENRLVGRGRVRYRNHSPNRLNVLMVHLRQNLQRADAFRNFPTGETTDGMELLAVRVGNQTLTKSAPMAGAGYEINGTLMQIRLPEAVDSGDEVAVEFEWQFTVPEGAARMGRDSTAYFLGYWYPQIAVYDDLHGWDAQQYRGTGEFYMEFAEYDVSIRAPEGWLLGATGVLQNPSEVLMPDVRNRLSLAAQSSEVVSIVAEDGRGAGRATVDAPNDTLTWRFRAERVRDFAFGASAAYVWDAVAANVGDADGDGVADTALSQALYRPEQTNWKNVAEFGRYGLEFLSDFIMPYPYPHATAVEGPFPFGGIEFPMITLIGGNYPPRTMFEVTVHEFAHNWWPMTVSSNEKRYMWQDEGPTHLATQRAGESYFEGWRSGNPDEMYLGIAGRETPIMRHGDLFPDLFEFLVAIYPKPKMAMEILAGLYGDDVAYGALRTYTREWAFRHPSPWDFFNTFERVLGDDLDWLWTSWYFETWTLDQAVANVESTDRGVMVTVADESLAPMPAPVTVTYADGGTSTQTLPVSAWLAGNREAQMLFPAGAVERVEIDPRGFMPDVDRGDNIWVAP